MRSKAFAIPLLAFSLLALAEPASADKCTGAKLKAVGKKEAGRLSCQSKVAAKNDSSGLAACETKASSKFSTAFGKAGACIGDETTCEGTADDCEANVATAMTEGFPSKCEAWKRKAAGKLARGELGCYAKAARTGSPVDGTCIAKARNKFSAAVAKAGACPDGGSPQTLVESNCVDPVVTTDGGGVVTDVCPTTTTTTASTTTSTTSTTLVPCNCCSATRLAFTTTLGGGDCGDVTPGACAVFDSGGAAGTPCANNSPCAGGTCIKDIACNGFYFGGGQDGQPLPAAIPDMGTSIFNIQSCNPVTGAFDLAATTRAETGSMLTCTSGPGAGAGTCSAGFCTQGAANGGAPCLSNAACGCFVGGPMAVVNPNSIATSVCLLNSVRTSATVPQGTGNCGGSVASLDLPLTAALYLVGDGLPKRCNGGRHPGGPCINNTACVPGSCVNDPDVQPCPICNPTTNRCDGGMDDGLACTPANSASLGPAYPTSQDCRPNPATLLTEWPVGLTVTTATQSKTSSDLGNQAGQDRVFCGYCATSTGSFQGPPSVPCTSNGQCTTGSFTVCRQKSNGAFSNPIATGISVSGSPAGCLADMSPHAAALASLACLPSLGSPLPDAVYDVPGPGAVAVLGTLQAQ